jgi:hypothetical protein
MKYQALKPKGQTRGYFLTELTAMGFSEVQPKSELFSYLIRIVYKHAGKDIAVLISAPGRTIDISVINNNQTTRFESYSNAWSHIRKIVK